MNLQYANLEPYYEKWAGLWRPPERLSLSQWAERYFAVSSDYGSKSGPLRLFGWQRGIFDAFTDHSVETVVLMCGTQLVKTLFLQVALAYAIVEQPGPALLVQPNDLDAEQFSKERLAPMLRDMAVLRARVSEAKSRTSSNTIQFKKFDGGSLSLVGAQTPGNLARRSIRYLFCDEIDKYPASAGSEGDPISLAFERTATYRGRRKIILTCSPTVKGRSRIGAAYAESDQRKPYVPCWGCGELQVLLWSNVRWDSGKPETARYECQNCGAHWNDLQRWDACDKAEWRAQADFGNSAGFWISHLYSPWKPLSEMVAKFLADKQDRQRFKTFVNTNLAELWEEDGSEAPAPEILKGRAEKYTAGPEVTVPRKALVLTAGVDVQHDRLEYEVVGWGPGKESWSLDYDVIRIPDGSGDWLPTSDVRLWDRLAEVVNREWRHEAGGTIPIMVMCIDTGDRPNPVYEFARRFSQPHYAAGTVRIVAPRTVVPVKGSSREYLKLIASISSEDAARKRYGIRIVSLGTAVAKQELFDNLRVSKPGPGYCHFASNYGIEYFEGLCSERRIVEDNGAVHYEKISNRRNEPLDCRVYARGGAAIFGIDAFNQNHWERLQRMLGIQEEVEEIAPEPSAEIAPQPPPALPAPPPRQARPRVIRSSWMHR